MYFHKHNPSYNDSWWYFLTLVITINFSALFLISCTKSSTDSGESSLSINSFSQSSLTASNGQAQFSISVPNDTAAFQVVATTKQGLISLLSLQNPDGSVVTQSSTEITRKATPYETSPHTVNFPYKGGAPKTGNYILNYELVDSRSGTPLSGEEVAITFFSKSDLNPGGGTLKVNMILIGPVGDSSNTRESLEHAVEIWREMYARAGILLDVAWYEIAGPEIIPDPRSGDSFYESVSLNTRSEAVNVILASDVNSLNNQENRFGIPGSTPGPIMPSSKSAVALSILAMTGRDGLFDFGEFQATAPHNDEERLAAEEMARLSARYIGLEDLVLLRGDKVSVSDSLSDTPSCLALTGCREDANVSSNLMFPFPLQKLDQEQFRRREFHARDLLTEEQREVLNGSVFVD